MEPQEAQSESSDASIGDAPVKEQLYRPPVRLEIPIALTVDQYLKTAGLKESIAAMVQAMFKKEILSFEAWDAKVSKLLAKRVH
jgi:hypothetical protein